MILKARTKPVRLRQLESLINRIPQHHPQQAEWAETLRRQRAGYAGECKIDKLWPDVDFPSPHYFLHDLFINKPFSTHQMDTVLITTRFALILEIKSMAGILHFDPELRQFSRTNKDGTIDGMANPDDQLRRHERWLSVFLKEQQIPLPVIGAIVFTYPSSIIRSKAGKRLIVHSSGLPFLIDKLHERFKEKQLPSDETTELAYHLLSLHSNHTIERPYSALSLMKGVLCPKCETKPMNYSRRKWICPVCAYADRHAYFDTLQQYRLLISSTITNKQFRDFTGLDSIATASKLLKLTGMSYTGSFKDRVYSIPDEISETESI